MRKLKGEGRTILFVSHKLDEVMAVADEITVMRAGPRRRDHDAGKTSNASLRTWSARPWKPTRIPEAKTSAAGPLLSDARPRRRALGGGGSARSISRFDRARSSGSPP